MSDGFALGVGDVRVSLGDHLCGFYAGDVQRDQIVLPFLEAALASGDKCICIVDGDPAQVVAMLDGAPFTATKQLEVIASADMYLRSDRFAAAEVIGAWKAAMSEVMYEGRFDAVRAVETWSQRAVVPDRDELLTLESEMNRYLPLYPQIILCLYDIERFGADVVIDVLRTHPRVLVGTTLRENPYYLTPDELRAEAAKAAGTSSASNIEEAAEWYLDATIGST